MTVITTTSDLSELCARLASADFITIDTEFLRDNTYWPKLCLVQVADDNEAAAIDPLAEGIDLAPLKELLLNQDVLKVFHAARQDIEIFFKLMDGTMPRPIFDTQIAAMVAGFGDSVGYETLVNKLVKARIDKSSRFTDWSRRPLTDKQLTYALSDVTHLRDIYRKLSDILEQEKRYSWVEQEMDALVDPAKYIVEPVEAWRRIKHRSSNRRFVGLLMELGRWREEAAQTRNVPRNRILRDEALLEIAAHPPKDTKELAKIRMVPKGFAEGKLSDSLMAAIATGTALPEDQLPQLPKKTLPPKGIGPLVDLFKVLLKKKCEEHEVAQRLIANNDDLVSLASDDKADIPATKGWRAEVFGNDALDLKHGRIALAAQDKAIEVIRLDGKE